MSTIITYVNNWWIQAFHTFPRQQQMQQRCKCCQQMPTGNTFKSQVTGRKYHIRNKISWKIKNLVYLISCRKCSLQYVRETENTLHVRMNGHCTEKIHRSSTQWRRERERETERCPHTGWTWTNDIMAYAITEYNVTAYANTRHTPRTIDSSLQFLYFLTTTVSILHGLFCTVCPALYAWRRSYGTETLHIVVKLCALKDCFRYSFKNILV